MLRVNLASITGAALELDVSIPPGAPVFEGIAFKLAEPVALRGRLSESGHGSYFLHGSLEARGVGQCRRCLREVTFDAGTGLEILFADEDDSGDPSVYALPANAAELDLSGMVREELILAAPALVTCSDDCRGLCAACGKDLNDGPCECRAEPDPRWAKLEELRNT